MSLTVQQQGFKKFISYGERKALLQSAKLFIQSIAAGFWISIYCHALVNISGFFFVKGDPRSVGIVRLIFAVIFPGAFFSIIYTGSELFTGNTVTMIMLLMDRGWKKVLDLIRVWVISFVGNCCGVAFLSFFLSYLSGDYIIDTGPYLFLFETMTLKIERSFLATLVLGFACNSLVCLATWASVSLEGSEKVLAIIFSIGTFAGGGYEHIVANLYYGFTALFLGYGNFGKIVLYNWLPSLLGNVIAGTIFTGMVWWYAFHPSRKKSYDTDCKAFKDLSHRQMTNYIKDFVRSTNLDPIESKNQHKPYPLKVDSAVRVFSNSELELKT